MYLFRLSVACHDFDNLLKVDKAKALAGALQFIIKINNVILTKNPHIIIIFLKYSYVFILSSIKQNLAILSLKTLQCALKSKKYIKEITIL